jgi:hypothetical protein
VIEEGLAGGRKKLCGLKDALAAESRTFPDPEIYCVLSNFCDDNIVRNVHTCETCRTLLSPPLTLQKANLLGDEQFERAHKQF